MGYDLNLTDNSPGLFVGATPDWQLAQQKVAAGNAFKDGYPVNPVTGQPDHLAAAQRLFQLGDYADGANLQNIGIQQQLARQAQQPSDVLGGSGAVTTPASTNPTSGFDSAVNRTLGFEGGLNPSDTNGTPTNYGINQAANPGVDVKNLTPAAAKAIYQSKYWAPIGGDALPPALQGMAFDTSVIAGPAKARQLVAQSGGDPQKFMDLREQFQNNLIQQDPAKYGAYANAWADRNAALRQSVTPDTPDNGGAPATASVPAPVLVANNGTSDAPAPSNTNPYGNAGAGGSTVPASSSAPRVGAAAAMPQAPQGQGALVQADPSVPAPAPASVAPGAIGPSSAAPPQRPATPYASNGSNLVDPTLGGLVSPEMLQKYGSYGGIAKALTNEAIQLSNNPYAKERVQALLGTAKEIMSTVSKAQELTTEQKNARDPLVVQNQTDLATTRAKARADAMAENALVPIAQPDGSTTLMPKKLAMQQAAAGNGPVVSLPGYVTSGQQNLQTKLSDGSEAYAQRQVAGERLDALSNLLSTYQTGANSTAFNNAAAQLRSYGINVPNSATINPSAMQQFTKDAYANVLSTMREGGNKQYAAEVQSAVNSNPSTDLQPAANAAMIAQIQGIQQYHDQNYRDYADWYNANKGASNDAKFQIDWAKANPLGTYISAAAKNIAPMGVPLPPKNQLVDGQAYMIKGQKARWSASANGFVPVGAN